MKHIMSSHFTISEAELDYLVKVVTATALLCKDSIFPLLLANNSEVGGGTILAPRQCKYSVLQKIFHLMILASHDAFLLDLIISLMITHSSLPSVVISWQFSVKNFPSLTREEL